MSPKLPLIFLFGTFAALASAHTGATGIVLERMHAMSTMDDQIGSLGAAMRGQAPYDQDAAQAVGRTIQKHANEMVPLFQVGTGGGVSEALPEIWSDPEQFAGLAEELGTLGESLSRVETFEEARNLVARINFNCSACHDRYRAD